MSNEVKAKAQAKGTPMPPRKATFTVTKEKGNRVFRAVNKRAHKWAKKQGKRSVLTVADMKAIKATGRVKLYAYDQGVLKAVRV